MTTCLMLFLCSCSAALRLGTEPVESQQTFLVTVRLSGPHSTTATPILSLFKNGERYGELEEDEPQVLTGLIKGELVTVGTEPPCSYTAGDEMTTCFFDVWKVVFKSQREVEDILNLNLLVTNKNSRMEQPFVVKINGTTQYSDSGTLAQGQTWWKFTPMDASAMATVLFTRTNASCAYLVAMNNLGKQTCETTDGMQAEFESVISRPYTGSYTDFSNRTDLMGWKVHIFIEKIGLGFDIFLENDKKFTVEPFTPTSPKLFDAELRQTVKLVFGEDDQHYYTYKVGDEKQSFKNLKGYTINFETMPKEKNN